MKQHLRRFGALAAFVAMMASFAPASAGGTAVTLTPNSTSTSPQEVNITWTSSGAYTPGGTIVVTAAPAFTSINNCAVPTTDLDNDATPDGSVTATTTGSATYSLTATTTLTAMSLCLRFTFPATPDNYTISFLSSNPVDFGSAILYANGGNLVTVTGTVPSQIDFAIRNGADTADTNTCALGTLSLASTSTCNYRLRIATNAANGFQAQIKANQDFGTGSATMTNVVNDGAQPAVGTEAYGLSLIVGATEGGRNTSTLLFTEPVVENNPAGFTFGTDPSPVPTSSAQNFISYGAAFQAGAAPSPTTTSLVEHAASITAGTAAGLYSQVVTYTVTGSF